jgi:hypothetical protein
MMRRVRDERNVGRDVCIKLVLGRGVWNRIDISINRR